MVFCEPVTHLAGNTGQPEHCVKVHIVQWSEFLCLVECSLLEATDNTILGVSDDPPFGIVI